MIYKLALVCAWLVSFALALASATGVAHAQADAGSTLAAPDGTRPARSTRGEARDRLAAERLASIPYAPFALRLSMDELLELDARLHGSRRPEGGFGGAATTLLVIGVPIALIGIGTLIAEALSALASAGAALSGAVSAAFSGSSSSSGGGDDPMPGFIAGGVILGAGAILAVTGLVIGANHAAPERPWRRRDRLRRQIWPALGIEVAPAAAGASVSLRGSF